MVISLDQGSGSHIPSLRRFLWASALAVACLITIAIPAQATESGTVAVGGHGEASAVPDLAVISVGVEVRKPTAAEAVEAHATSARALLDSVHAQGVSDRDIRTENMWLNPVYEYDESGNSHLAGFQAGQAFSVKVRDVTKTGKVLRAAVDAVGDAGRINGVSFDVEDRAALRHRARAAAFKDARAKAAQYAQLSGQRLGDLLSVNEAASSGAAPIPMLSSQDADGVPVPVALGEIREEIDVVVVYQMR
ncbi:SIMPL domain-containing protein [Lentzea sp. NPDC005914]|uniref:SIMPL domain-containing protein n=1 Tax=Lentzea sp. NPDC005914 TaxID=3154572 RepID=UPI0033F1E056